MVFGVVHCLFCSNRTSRRDGARDTRDGRRAITQTAAACLDMGGGRRKPRHEAPRPSDSSQPGRCRAPCASATGAEPVAAAAAEVDLAEELAAMDFSSWAAPCVLPSSVLGSTDGRRGEVVLMEHANVFECPVVVKDLTPLRQTFEKLRPVAGSPELLRCERRGYTFHVERPSWKSDIAWIAANDAATFRGFFQAANP